MMALAKYTKMNIQSLTYLHGFCALIKCDCLINEPKERK